MAIKIKLINSIVLFLNLDAVISYILPITQCKTPSLNNNNGYSNCHSSRWTTTKLPISKETTTSTTMFAKKERIRNISFKSPLLDYGYPPTVQEHQNGTLSKKPLLPYLPGFDGTYICPFIQYPNLAEEFEIMCLTIKMDDRSTFQELKQDVLQFLRKQSNSSLTISSASSNIYTSTTKSSSITTKSPSSSSTTTKSDSDKSGNSNPFWSILPFFNNNNNNNDDNDKSTNNGNIKKPRGRRKKDNTNRPIYIAGESFGGILAAEVALTILNEQQAQKEAQKQQKQQQAPNNSNNVNNINLQGLILINSATCYDRSQLAVKGPQVANIFPILYPFALLTILPLFADQYSFPQLIQILQGKSLPSVIDTAQKEAYMGRVAFSLPRVLEYMPRSTLKWRLQEWLNVGCNTIKLQRRFIELSPSITKKFRTLVIAGECDLTLPSIAEAERVANVLPNCMVHVVPGAGHASTCGSRLDFMAVIRNRFEEFQAGTNKNKGGMKKRTEMKPIAAASKPDSVDFGMEPRYDGLDYGINPIFYWSPELYKKATIVVDQVDNEEMN